MPDECLLVIAILNVTSRYICPQLACSYKVTVNIWQKKRNLKTLFVKCLVA
jgi:hypothetical protein